MSMSIPLILGLIGLLSMCFGVNAKLKGDDCEGKL